MVFLKWSAFTFLPSYVLYVEFNESSSKERKIILMKGCVKNEAYLLPRSAICVVISRFFSFCGLVIPSTLGKSSASSSSLESTENLASIIVIFRPRPWPREQHKFSLLNCHLITQKPEFRSRSERCSNADFEYCRIIIKLGLLRRIRRTTLKWIIIKSIREMYISWIGICMYEQTVESCKKPNLVLSLQKCSLQEKQVWLHHSKISCC